MEPELTHGPFLGDLGLPPLSTTASSSATVLPSPPEKEYDPFQVILEPSDDPQTWSLLKKWSIVVIISSAGFCVGCASSMASFAEGGIAKELHVSHEVTILSLSLFAEGLGIGPLLVGPLSEVYGRTNIYRVSYALFFVFMWPVAFAPDIAVLIIFRFITGFCGAAFLSVAGGSVTDLFSNATVANPMAFYTISPFVGTVLGPVISGFINQNADWRWTYRVLIIWVFVECIFIFFFIPETYVPVVLVTKARRTRKETHDEAYWAPLERQQKNVMQAIVISCYKPFQLIFHDEMAFLLDLWSALVLGIFYLTFQAFSIIFENGHGFNMQSTGLSFLGIGLGMIIGAMTQPLWNRLFANESRKNGGVPRIETRLIMGQLGAILVPISLYWLAFTTYPSVHWIVPIIASIPFGTGISFVYTSVFTYMVTTYRPIAASALASNVAMRFSFAAAFPLFAKAMYDRLGTVGATALLAGLTTLMAPLPFIFYHFGPRLRAKSKFAVS